MVLMVRCLFRMAASPWQSAKFYLQVVPIAILVTAFIALVAYVSWRWFGCPHSYNISRGRAVWDEPCLLQHSHLQPGSASDPHGLRDLPGERGQRAFGTLQTQQNCSHSPDRSKRIQVVKLIRGRSFLSCSCKISFSDVQILESDDIFLQKCPTAWRSITTCIFCESSARYACENYIKVILWGSWTSPIW